MTEVLPGTPMTKPARLSFCLLSLTLEVLRVEGLMKLFACLHYGLAE